MENVEDDEGGINEDEHMEEQSEGDEEVESDDDEDDEEIDSEEGDDNASDDDEDSDSDDEDEENDDDDIQDLEDEAGRMRIGNFVVEADIFFPWHEQTQYSSRARGDRPPIPLSACHASLAQPGSSL